MPFSRRKSYTEKVEGRRKLLLRMGVFLLVFVVFEIISGLFLKTYSVSSDSMAPTLRSGDHLLVSPLPLGPLTAFGKLPPMVKPRRGDLVLVRPPFVGDAGFFATLARSFVRFVTLQLYAPSSAAHDPAVEGPFVVRVIALPGDEVSMDDFVFMVKSGDSEDSLTEFEFSSRRYDIHKPALPEGWTRDFPLSGSMQPRVLGKDEYFVAVDDRGSSADSRTWGPVNVSSFVGKVLLVYWPFGRFGGL